MRRLGLFAVAVAAAAALCAGCGDTSHGAPPGVVHATVPSVATTAGS